jgi:hypothetical protein
MGFLISIVVLVISIAFPSILSAQIKMVTLYRFNNYGGKIVNITKNVPDLRDSTYDFNDMASSLRLMGVNSIAVFEGVNYTGKCQTFTSDQKNLSSTAIGANNISSIKLDAECQIHGPVIMLYEHNNFGGKYEEIRKDTANLGTLNFNNKASSMKLYGVTSAAVYEDKDFWGKCQTYTKNQLSLISNDTMSSIRINKKCEDFIQITVKNNSAAVLQISYPNDPGYGKELSGGLRHRIILKASYAYNFVRIDRVDLVTSGEGGTSLTKLCDYNDFIGGKTYKIALSGYVNQTCVKTEE